MNRCVLSGLLCIVGLASCTKHAPTLDGQWTPVSAELAGQDLPVANFGGATLQLTDSTYEFAGDKGTYIVLSAKSPGKMDIRRQAGPHAGRTIAAIFELSDEQLTIGYQLGSGERPIEFTSPQGSQVLIVQYKRTH